MTLIVPSTSKYATVLPLYRTHADHPSLVMVMIVVVLLTRTDLLSVGTHTRAVHVFQSFQIPAGRHRLVTVTVVMELLIQMGHHSVETISMVVRAYQLFRTLAARRSLVTVMAVTAPLTQMEVLNAGTISTAVNVFQLSQTLVVHLRHVTATVAMVLLIQMEVHNAETISMAVSVFQWYQILVEVNKLAISTDVAVPLTRMDLLNVGIILMVVLVLQLFQIHVVPRQTVHPTTVMEHLRNGKTRRIVLATLLAASAIPSFLKLVEPHNCAVTLAATAYGTKMAMPLIVQAIMQDVNVKRLRRLVGLRSPAQVEIVMEPGHLTGIPIARGNIKDVIAISHHQQRQPRHQEDVIRFPGVLEEVHLQILVHPTAALVSIPAV